MDIPKKIWLYWSQGDLNMPEIVKSCFYSWKNNNPDWKLILITQDNLNIYLEEDILTILQRSNISIQAKSDIIRINLLKSHGGIWVDSTCFCCQPLNEWIYDYCQNGFFAFSKPKGKYTLISSWFLVSAKKNYITEKFCEETNKYWQTNIEMQLWNKKLICRYILKYSLVSKYLFTHPQKWFLPVFTKTFKIHPYFWFHYLFEKCYIGDEYYKYLWDMTPEYSSDIPHRLQNYGLTKEISLELKHEINEKNSPVYKLNWRVPHKKGSILTYLLKEN